MVRRILPLLLTAVLAINVYGQQNNAAQEEYNTIKVEGTEMAQLPYVLDVLKQIPKVSVSDNKIFVIGRGTAAIYIGNRKVTDLTELSHIAASYVSSITVMTQPGAEYEKNVQAVILIEPVKDNSDGLSGEGTLRFDLTNKIASNAEATLRWRQKAFQLGALIAYNEVYHENKKKSFNYHYQNQNLVSKEKNTETPDNYKQTWTGRLFSSYAFNDKHLLSLNYTLMNLRINRTFIPEVPKTKRNPQTRHDIGMEYTGTLGAWSLSMGNNTFFDNIEENAYKPQSFDYYLRKQSNTRTYALAKRALGNGNLALGAEYKYDKMEMNKYEDNYSIDDSEEAVNHIHANNSDNTTAAFLLASQKFGKWTIEGGLRYEHQCTIYKPCSDDGLTNAIDEYFASNPRPTNFNLYPIIEALYIKRELRNHHDLLFPSLKITTTQGKSQFTLTHTQSSVKPSLGFTRLAIKDLRHLADKIVKTERISTTSLDWKYQWLNLTATYTHFTDPICSTISGSVSYTAPDYDAFDFNTTLSPRIGIWAPVLNLNVHKQWFYMELANGKDKLYDILCRISFDNTISLPSDWMVLVNANWHGKGGERNWYFYKPDLCINASIQKEFPRQRLTLILNAQNILRDSYLDVTRYTQAYNNISEGARENNIRSISITAKWKY